MLEFHSPVGLEHYHQKLSSLQLDMAIAPLADHDFNRAKSNLKLLEYGALGLPVICSKIEPYLDSPARQLDEQIESWVDAIRELAADKSAREEQGRRMKDWMSRNYYMEDQLGRWAQAFWLD